MEVRQRKVRLEEKDAKEIEEKKIDETKRREKEEEEAVIAHREFGGAPGAVGLMIFSHSVLYYFWISQQFYNGAVIGPNSFQDVVPFFQRMFGHIQQHAAPTAFAAKVYLGFLLLQLILGFTLPGITVKGLPVPSEKGKQLDYLCNGVSGWWVTLAIVFVLNYTETFRLSLVVDHFGELMTCAILSADTISILLFIQGILSGKAIRMSGNIIYDFFMGSALNPRIFFLDLKLWAEIRVSWILLFLLTCAAASKQYEETGTLSPSMMFMMTAHFLYTNACQKGEECIP
jgi:delta24(24(1))-sterol reductase